MPRSPVYSKSEIAIEYAYRLKESAPDIWVFWVHASNAARFEQAYRDIAAKVDLPGRDDPKTDILRLVCNWLCDEKNGRWLMNLVGKTEIVAQVEPMKEKDALMLLKTRVSVSESLEAHPSRGHARGGIYGRQRADHHLGLPWVVAALPAGVESLDFRGSTVIDSRRGFAYRLEASAFARWGCDLGYGGPAVWVTVRG